MGLILEIFACVSIFCFVVFLAIQWLDGEDTRLLDIILMIGIAAIPGLNVILLFRIMFECRELVVLKGRKK